MKQPSLQEHDHALVLPEEDRGQKCRQFKGTRLRKWGSWVSEIRMPRSREKLWLGSYATAQQAARAYDAAVYCLRGPNSKFNFPNSVPHIPFASSLSRRQIQLAAAKYALDQLPSSPPSLQENGKINKATEEAASPSRSGSVSETELSSDSHHILEKHHELDFCESLFGESEGNNVWGGAKFNFPNSVPYIPSASSLSRRQIQLAAAKYALDQLPSSPPSVQENEKINKAREEAASPSRTGLVSETELSSNSHQILEKHHELDFWESLFEVSNSNDGWGGLNLERMPSIDEAPALDFICSTWEEEQQEEGHMNILVDSTELWIF